MSLQVWSALPLHVRCVWSWFEGSGQENSRGAGLRQLPAGRSLLHAGWADIWDHCRVQSPADAGGWRRGLVQLSHAHLKWYWCEKDSPLCIYIRRCLLEAFKWIDSVVPECVQWTIVHELVHILGERELSTRISAWWTLLWTRSFWHLWTAHSHSLTSFKTVPDFHRAFQVKTG